LAEDTLLEFGSSKELIKSVVQALKGKMDPSYSLCTYIEAAYQIASYEYEYGTGWGTKVSDHMVNIYGEYLPHHLNFFKGVAPCMYTIKCNKINFEL
jgi:hypothetical protein